MNAMDLERQRWQEYQLRKLEASIQSEQAEQDAQFAKVRAQKQTVFDQAILDQLMSEAGYNNFRVRFDDGEWDVQEKRKAWGWETIDGAGFGSRRTVKMYKTLTGACKRVKKELGE